MADEIVRFRSRSETLAGILTRPDGAKGPTPLVIMAGGWCYTKEIVMPHYAKFFHAIGCATLRFDYRNFGESTGEPRQHIDPWAQVEDYRNAFCFAETLPNIDLARTGIWGISYSGGHVLVVAALDHRPAFAISTIPVVDGRQTLRRNHGEARFAKLMKLALDDRRRRFADGKASAYMAMSPQGEEKVDEISAWPFPHVYAGFMPIKEREAPLHEHYNTIESVENLFAYRVIPYAREVYETPVLMTLAHGDNITSADLETEVFNAIPNPDKTFVSVRGVDHMSLYTNYEHLGKVGRVQSDWLKQKLGELA
jgi:pimeloyl-ACP methyl ester carboxylesterase